MAKEIGILKLSPFVREFLTKDLLFVNANIYNRDKSMKDVYIIRNKSDVKQTLGVLIAPLIPELFVCKTLELPWKDNVNNASCIPIGSYICRYTQSARLSRVTGKAIFTYEVLNVANRLGIRIHSANYFSQLSGCVALGDTHKDINFDGQLDVIHSGDTIKKFVDLMEQEDFILHIISIELYLLKA